MSTTTRRAFLKGAALTVSAGFWQGLDGPLCALAAPEETPPPPTKSEEAAIAEIVTNTMEKYHAPALSLAIARHGQFVYRKAFGWADKDAGAPATTDSLFRIASVSKPITSVAIFSLLEQGRLGLNDLVFGEHGLLGFDYGGHYPELVQRITLHHLLTHTCGGWQNDGNDPMFHKPAMNHRELITWAVQNLPLEHEPGDHYAYSNFGYCILGRVIEKITGLSYADFVRQQALAKCGIAGMRVGGNTLAQRAAGEVVYYGQTGSGANPYGMNVTRMDSHGGWIATPTDLVQFAMHVDGFKTTRAILSPESIKTMTTATSANPNYACGWCVNRIPNWWHGGSLPGTLTIMVRTASGLCWAAFTNTRAEGLDLDGMMWKVVQSAPAWRA